jgi:hypothetical protein
MLQWMPMIAGLLWDVLTLGPMRAHVHRWRRPHGSLGGKTPIDCVCELVEAIPLWEDVAAAYDGSKERIRHRDFTIDQALAAIWAARKPDQRASRTAQQTLQRH